MAGSPIENAVGRFYVSVLHDMMRTVGEAVVASATSRTSKQFLAFLEEASTPPGQELLAQAHAEMAHGMQDAVIRSWGQAKRKLRPAVYNPIRTSRFHGGMDRAVNDPDLVQSSARGIQFGNVAVLDRDAAQWARLNVGAGPRGQGSSAHFSVRFSNLPAIEFSFQESARTGYGLPRGVFRDSGGGFAQPGGSGFQGPRGAKLVNFLSQSFGGGGVRSGAFYPFRGAKQEFPTQGNVGYNYLDAGIARLFSDRPDGMQAVYGRLFRNLLPSSRRVGRPPIIAETRRITR